MTVAQQMRDAIPGARLAVIAGAGRVSNLEEPGPVQCRSSRLLLDCRERVIPSTRPLICEAN
jgi:hypothetical protein